MSQGTLETLALFIARALEPLTDELQPDKLDQFLRSLGLSLPSNLTTAGPVPVKAGEAGTAVGQVTDTIAPLVTALGNLDLNDLGTVPPVVEAGADTVTKIITAVEKITEFADALDAQTGTLEADAADVAEQVTGELAVRILEVLILGHLDRNAPSVTEILPLIGLVEDVEDPGDSTGVVPPFRYRRLFINRFAELLTDPQSYFRDYYRFGHSDFNGMELFQPIEKLLKDNNMPVMLIQSPGSLPVLEAFLMKLHADDSQSPPGLSAQLRVPGTQNFSATRPLSDIWSFFTNAEASFSAGAEVNLTPAGALSFVPGDSGGSIDLTASTGFIAERDDGRPMTLLGVTGATRLTLKKFEAVGGFTANFDTTSGQANAEPVISFALEDLKAHLEFGDGDSFLQSISGGGSGAADVSLGATWSPSSGIKFNGSSSMEIAIPAHVSIGPATLESVFLVGGFDLDNTTPEVPIEISAGIKGELGPLTATVERVGLKLTFTAPPDGGNLGPLNLEAGFKPPNGIGLAVDGGGMSGGGYLFLDPDRGEYAGALELKFQGVIHLKAIGVLNTILPDGSDGFSLMILITAEFTPIQLGFGFTLNGVGGLIGINRTMMLDVLGDGVRDGTLQSILFPDDVVANASAIISDLQSVFPPMNGRFIVGPMAKLGWGTPTLVTLELGVLIEIPRPAFAVIGILSLALPSEDVPILELNVAFAGSVDFEKKQLRFDASIFDSRVLSFTLTGDMALRIYWGENANFLMTVGGFHPAYTPPPMDLPAIRRLAITLMSGNPRISAEAYFAVTSNTVQFGGKIEAYAGADIFNVYGHVSLDALIQFNPFHFIVSLSAMVAARTGSTVLFSVSLNFTLEGPTPWHAFGTASFSISLFFFDIDVSISFDVTVGAEENTSLPPVDALDELVSALQNVENWTAVSASSPDVLVSLRDIGDASRQVMHPSGALSLSQKSVPLNMEIERFGSRDLAGGNRLSINELSIGGEVLSTNATRDEFAPAQFFNLSNSEKLSRDSFENYEAGIASSASDEMTATLQRKVPIEHELAYIERPEIKFVHKLSDAIISAHLLNSAVAQSPLAKGPKIPTGLGTPPVSVTPGIFVVADVDTLDVVGATTAFSTEAEASLAMAQMQASDPALSGKLQVVAEFDLVA